MYHLYHIETGRIIESSKTRILPDEGGPLPRGDFAELVDETDPQPEAPAGHTLEPYTEADVVAGKLRTRWRVVPIVIGPVTKLTIKRRLTEAEWAAVKAAIASDPEASEEWELATEIDPEHPKTAAMVAALQSGGILTTPTTTVFAQN